MTEIEFYFDFLSPYSYLAYRIARVHFKYYKLILKPVSLPHIITSSGNIPPASLEARRNYFKMDLQRSAEFYGLEENFKVPARFPFDTRNYLYELVKMIEEGTKSSKEIDEFVMKTWIKIFHEGDIETGPEPANKSHCKYLLMKNTEEALKLGAYGVPFWRIKNDKGQVETFFGSDRFHHIAKFIGIDPAPIYSKI